MASKKSATIQPDPILGSAASLWKYFTTNAGLDSFFYDKELLLGNEAEKGLYAQLGISKKSSNFEKDLEHYKITVENLLVAFFKTLQPFAQMMNDICVFFEHHRIKETNKSFSIRFNSDAVNGEELEFNLEHFRQTLSQLNMVKQLVDYFHLNSNQCWKLTDLFGNEYSGSTKNTSARQWLDSYNKTKDYDNQHKAVFNSPELEIPTTGNALLNQQLNRVIAIWKSFVRNCRNIDTNRNRFIEKMKEVRYNHDNSAIDEITAPWSALDLRNIESDFWPATLLEKLFYRLEQIETLPVDKRIQQEATLATSIQNFLQQLPQSQVEEEQLLQELIDLLKLPLWQRRSELYAVWILTLIDDAAEEYSRKIHHNDGMLSLSFAATHIATIETHDGDIQLWSEVRSLVEGTEEKPLEGKSRKNNIQPDYAIYKNDNTAPADCIVAIEVKQYREHSTSNFKAALNDYTRGLPNANVILVNYGSVSERISLASPDRSHFFGQIKPKSPEIDSFKIEVQKYFPKQLLPKIFTIYDQVLLFKLPIDHLYVDISGSLDQLEYKLFVEELVIAIINMGKVKRLVAGGTGIADEWINPDASSVKELVALPFNNTTEFAELIPNNGHVVVITDDDGVKSIEIASKSVYIIQYNGESDQEIRILENGLIIKT